MSFSVKIIPIVKNISSDKKIDYSKIILKIEMPKILDLKVGDNWTVFFKVLIKGGMLKIIVDMSSLGYIESSGIGMLINTAKLLRKNEGDIVFINVTEEVEQIFHLVNLQRFIKTYGTLDDAISYLRLL